MEKLKFNISIKAQAAVVYNTMLGITNKKTYEAWTFPFNAHSTYEGTWEKGSKMYFVGLDEKGEKGGMVSTIEELIPNQFVSILHYGMLKGNQEITSGKEVEAWAGGHENYTFKEENGSTLLEVEIDIVKEFSDYFVETYPKALEKLKEITINK